MTQDKMRKLITAAVVAATSLLVFLSAFLIYQWITIAVYYNRIKKTQDDIAYYVLHQANFRILDYIRHRFGVDGSRLPMNVDRLGNTSSASIPMLLDELNREGKLKKGDLLAFSAFGAGFTSGACIIEWNK